MQSEVIGLAQEGVHLEHCVLERIALRHEVVVIFSRHGVVLMFVENYAKEMAGITEPKLRVEVLQKIFARELASNKGVAGILEENYMRGLVVQRACSGRTGREGGVEALAMAGP